MAVQPVVVVADDDADMRRMVATMVELALGAAVVEAADGQQALSALRARPARVLLLDMQMPVLDGPETLRALRADPQLRGLPVVVMSAAGSEAAARAVGCDAFLRKPFGLDALAATLRPYLEGGAGA